MNPIQFWKYHGLGNDYLVIDSARTLTASEVVQICHRNYGIGADGILVQLHQPGVPFAVQIFNPDGSEAEKSGNGLRIFARYLFDTGQVKSAPFTIMTAGGAVTAQLLGPQQVRVSMGRAEFDAPTRLSVLGGQQSFDAHPVSIGNPHCVIFCEGGVEEAERLASRWGRALELHPYFPNRTNVQFVHVLNRQTIYIAIWERGAERTLASGSSSCAAAAVAHRLGHCSSQIAVNMLGGRLDVQVEQNGHLILAGAVVKVGEGKISAEIFP